MFTGICVGMYFSRPLFIRLRVAPMATVETVTPTSRPHLLPEGSGADEIAGFQILRSGAGDGGGDANDAADHERENGVVGSGPAGDEEDGAGGHQRGDAHAADGIGRIAEEAADAAGDGDEEKSENDDEDRGEEILIPMSVARLGWDGR